MGIRDAITDYLRARRNVADVDPETGEEDLASPGGKNVGLAFQR